jgi:hypothetical protein
MDLAQQAPHSHFVATMMIGNRKGINELQVLTYGAYFMERFFFNSKLKSTLSANTKIQLQEIREVKGLFTLMFYFSYCNALKSSTSSKCINFIPKVNLPDIVRSFQNQQLREALWTWYQTFNLNAEILQNMELMNFLRAIYNKWTTDANNKMFGSLVSNLQSSFRAVFSTNRRTCHRYVYAYTKKSFYPTLINDNHLQDTCRFDLDAGIEQVKLNRIDRKMWITIAINDLAIESFNKELQPKSTDSSATFKETNNLPTLQKLNTIWSLNYNAQGIELSASERATMGEIIMNLEQESIATKRERDDQSQSDPDNKKNKIEKNLDLQVEDMEDMDST